MLSLFEYIVSEIKTFQIDITLKFIYKFKK